MDIQTPPGYVIKAVDDNQSKSIAAIDNNSNGDVNAYLSYIINLEQPDGTSQVLHLTEEEAKCLGIFSDDMTDNNMTNIVNTTENVLNFIGVCDTSRAKEPVKRLKKRIIRPKKSADSRKNSVAVICNDSLKEKLAEADMHSYSLPVLQPDNKSEMLQLAERETTAFKILLNDTSENGITNTANGDSNITADLVETVSMSHVAHSTKCSNKVIKQHKKVINARKDIADINNDSSQKLQQSDVNLLSYSSTTLQSNGSLQIVQLSEGETTALGSFSNGLPKSSITNSFEAMKTLSTNSIRSTNGNNLKRPVKHLKKAAALRKKIVGIKKSTVEETDINLKEKRADGNLLSYSSVTLQADETSSLVQLSSAETKPLGIFSNSKSISNPINSIETTTNVANPGITVNTSPIKQLFKHPRKPVPHGKEVVGIKKNIDADVCSSSKEIHAESVKPLGSCENPIEIIKDGEVLHSTQNLSQDYLQQIAEALQFRSVGSEVEEDTANDTSSNVVYRVVFPEELNLNPKPPKPHRRGRPKKRSYSSSKEKEPPVLSEEPKPIKNMRTRSGRITRPPQHIKKDFEKIDTSEVDNMETDLKTVEFEPLKTNQPPTAADTPVKIRQLENHQRKRSIAAQFRCPKCKKAYLGHSKMLKHLQKHPDHGPIPERCKPKDTATWNFLIDLCNKSPVGQRGSKFCKELGNFLQSVRILAKILFKRPAGLDKNLYFVDSDLSSVLGIESGNYVLNENELHKEVNMLDFVNNKCYSEANADSTENILNNDVKTSNDTFDLDTFVQKCQTNSPNINEIAHENLTFMANDHCSALNGDSDNDFNHKLGSNEVNKNSKLSGTLEESSFHENKFSFDNIQSSEHNDFSLNCDITSVRTFNADLQKFGEQIISDFTDRNINGSCERETPQLVLNNSTVQIEEQNSHEKSVNLDLSLHSELLSDNSLLNSLPNLRTSVEELMLNNVDSTQVTNLLDNSTSSDEVMNVDQFVNESVKNLTESDLELPNTSLSLDLPSLDLFQFHTS